MRRPFLPLLLGSLAVAFGCSDTSGPTSPPEPVGSYVATQFLTTANGETIDQLGQGVTVTITLGADRMISGQLFVPAASDQPLSLAGTWSQQGDTVSFHGPVDTFLQHLSFRVTSSALEGDGTVGPGRIQITLTRRGARQPSLRVVGSGE